MYPVVAYAIVQRSQLITRRLIKQIAVVVLVGMLVARQVTTTFQFANDPGVNGFAVGKLIAVLQQAAPTDSALILVESVD